MVKEQITQLYDAIEKIFEQNDKENSKKIINLKHSLQKHNFIYLKKPGDSENTTPRNNENIKVQTFNESKTGIINVELKHKNV